MNKLPEILQNEYQNFYNDVQSLIPDEYLSSADTIKVIACSPFAAEFCRRSHSVYIELQTSGDLETTFKQTDYESRLATTLTDVNSTSDLMRSLRQFRNREMIRILWRDITQKASLTQTLEELSILAETLLDQTLEKLHQWLVERYGEPLNGQGEPQKMVVIAAGKLGAHELNYSSDIDLIFTFPEKGETKGGQKQISNQEFFIQLGRQLINQFSKITADGFVFRVDMRLRPFGQSGALVLNFDAMEEYYITHARDWERYAMIKANIAAGDKEAGKQLMAMFKPFVFRRYLDYTAFDAIREMKALINREVLKKGMSENVKLGAGGIREIEFIGQTFQLLRGGREPSLQQRSILNILTVMDEMKLLSGEEITELKAAYYFLRNTEHRLQQIADKQTQSLPESEIDQARVALGMGFENWDQFKTALDVHRNNVSNQFGQLLKKPEEEHDEIEDIERIHALYQGELENENAIELLEQIGFLSPDTILDNLKGIGKNYSAKKLSRIEGERLDRLFPNILKEVVNTENQKETLQLIIKLIDSVIHRSVYISLLTEQPMALTQLVKLCSASPWIADYITQQPILLDDLINIDNLYAPMELEQLVEKIERQLNLLEGRWDDLELRMNQLRHFKHSQVLRVAAADITGQLPVAMISNYLSMIAESVVGAAYQLAWGDMTQKYGAPCYVIDGKKRPANLCIIAYGKLGGLELGYGSDLDVVFIHDSQGEEQMTNGENIIENGVFFNRLAQRMIHFLTVMTSAGRTYEIDTRLRPSGSSGLLVSSMNVFRDYQFNKAWTPEHQALVRARFIYGDKDLKNNFEDIRKQILSQPRDENKLKNSVVDIREKMYEALINRKKGSFDLKQGRGGMVDIEFIVQYSVLRWACEHPELLQWTDNLRLLETLATLQLMNETDSQLLRDAYFAYRANAHRLALQDKKAIVSETEYTDHKNNVKRIWQELIG